MMRRPALFLATAIFVSACGGTETLPPEQKPPRILSFRANPVSIEQGQEVTLSWESTGTTGVNIEPRVGLGPAAGSAIDRPLVTTTYTLSIPGGPADLVARVTVEVGGGPQVELFTATPRTIAEGESAALEWRTVGAESVSITPDVGVQAASGNVVVMPSVTTTYRLVAHQGPQASLPSEVTVVVASGNQPVVKSFVASPMRIQAGMTATLSWDVGNAESLSIDNGVGTQPVMGSVTVSPVRTTTYSLTAVGAGGQASASVVVTVAGGGNPTITYFTATPVSIAPGGTAKLSWDTDNADGVVIDQGIGAQDAKGEVTVMPSRTTTYNLTALGSGMMVMQAVTVTVGAPNAPAVSTFTAQPSAILTGGTTTLSWTTQNATSVDIDQGAGTGLAANGTLQVNPAQTTTYTLTARGTTGMATGTVTVTVTPPPPTVASFTAQPAAVTAGSPTMLSWTTQDATSVTIDNGVGAQPPTGSVSVSPTQTTQYTLTAMGPSGSATAQVTVSVNAAGTPTITAFTSSPQQIAPGGQATLSWTVSGATGVSIDRGLGTRPLSGTVTVSPATSTTYTLTATGPGGTANAQVTVAVVSIVGDTCADAFSVSASGSFTGNTLTATNDYSASNSCTGYASSGPDVVYRISLQTGDRLRASLAPSSGNWDSSLYLVTSCSNIAQSCVAGQDNGNPEEIDYTAVSAGTYYLIVDGYAGAGGPYALTIDITAAPIPNDTCAGAINVTAGGVFTGDTTNAANDYTPLTTGTGGCTGYTAASGDVTYRVDLAAGERLQASLDAAWDASLYVVTNCANTTGTCVAGQDNGNPEQVDYMATSPGTYFLIVDGWNTARGPFTLTVSISPPVQGGDTCQSPIMVPTGGGSFQSSTTGLTNDYSPTACLIGAQPGPDQVYALTVAAGDVVEAESTFAAGLDGSLYAVSSCSPITGCSASANAGGAGQSERLRFVAQTAGSRFIIVDSPGGAGSHDLTVARYGGDTCADAAPLLTAGVFEWFSTAGRANSYSPNAGGCTGFSASGADRAYWVAVTPGDQVHAEVDPDGTYDASLYLVGNCADVNGSCVAGSDSNGSANEIIAPVFQQSGTYYLIIDGFFGASGTGQIAARIRRGDTCADAYYVPPQGGTFRGTTAGYGADYGITVNAGSCTTYSQLGNDAVYAVTLQPNQTLNASITSTWDSSLYLIRDCAASATTCVAGQDNGNPETITYQHTGSTAQTYFLVVDSWRTSDAGVTRDGAYTLTITFP